MRILRAYGLHFIIRGQFKSSSLHLDLYLLRAREESQWIDYCILRHCGWPAGDLI